MNTKNDMAQAPVHRLVGQVDINMLEGVIGGLRDRIPWGYISMDKYPSGEVDICLDLTLSIDEFMKFIIDCNACLPNVSDNRAGEAG